LRHGQISTSISEYSELEVQQQFPADTKMNSMMCFTCRNVSKASKNIMDAIFSTRLEYAVLKSNSAGLNILYGVIEKVQIFFIV
jgi:hypothetical protein